MNPATDKALILKAVREFFRRCSRNYSKGVFPEMAETWADLLADVPVERLETVFARWLQTSKFMANIADIRGLSVVPEEARETFEAEKAWAHVQHVLRNHYYLGKVQPIMASKVPDGYKGRVQAYNGGFLLYPELFSAATEYALNQVGDLGRVASLGYDEHDFVRKDFIAGFKRHRETYGLLAPTREEARLEAQSVLDDLKRRREQLTEGDGAE